MLETPWLTNDKQQLVSQLLSSHQTAFGRALLTAQTTLQNSQPQNSQGKNSPEQNTPEQNSPAQNSQAASQQLFALSIPVLAHDGGTDPKLTYANAAALELWKLNWQDMIGMPSRLTAPEEERHSRAAALNKAQQVDAIEGYSGIRINSKGQRFRINNACIWTIKDANGKACGQAATIANWCWL